MTLTNCCTATTMGFALALTATLTVMGQSYTAPRTPWILFLQGTYTYN